MSGLLWGVLGAMVTVAVQWGSLQIQIRWIRADVDRAHQRLDFIERRAHPRD